MASQSALRTIFKSEEYASSFKRGEMVTHVFAEKLVEQSKVVSSNVDPNEPLVVLDNACGAGVVSSVLNQQLDPNAKKHLKLTCGDISPAVLKYTQSRMEEENWQTAETQIVDAQSPGLPSSFYDYVFTAFAYMALPESVKALDETVRMLKPGGTIAFSTWKETGWIPIARKAIESISRDLPFPGSAELLAVLSDGEWHSVAWIKSQLVQRGFEDIDVRVETATTSLESSVFVDMTMFMLPVVMKYFWSEEQREKYEPEVRTALVKSVEDIFGRDQDTVTEWEAIISTARKSS
ncbi:unnamed protein product [Penicillium olsonii]|uniref:Methyltransferase domain-containing protein n=1 Tax=Penicillium olsonii TaxID=99116 RepID=A0A9W4MQF9_PENOL|nr:unnamed protein product [Penicillium olsonii]CAG8080928.1 unnamed protein product [Penicillium olsonii]